MIPVSGFELMCLIAVMNDAMIKAQVMSKEKIQLFQGLMLLIILMLKVRMIECCLNDTDLNACILFCLQTDFKLDKFKSEFMHTFLIAFTFTYIINWNFISYLIITHPNNSVTKTMATLSTISPQSAVQWAKKHPLPTCLAFGSFSAISFYLLRNLIRTPCKKRTKVNSHINESNEKQETQVRKQLQRLKISREKLHAATKDFKLQFEDEQILTKILTEDCVLAIFDQCIDLVDQVELNRIYQNSRAARRTVFRQILINAEIKSSPHKQSHQEQFPSHNSELLNESFPAASQITTPKNMSSLKSKLAHSTPITYPEAMSFSQVYYRFVCTFEEEFKYLIEKTQKDFAVFLNIDFSLITESIDFHISKQNNEYFKQRIEEWTSGIRQTLKNKLTKYNQPIDPVQIRQILKHQVAFLTQKRHKLRETINRLGISNEQELDALPTLLATILEDQVFYKYHIEQEQMTVDMMHLSKNKELEELVDQFQILTEEIVEEMYEEVNKDAIQVDDQQEV